MSWNGVERRKQSRRVTDADHDDIVILKQDMKFVCKSLREIKSALADQAKMIDGKFSDQASLCQAANVACAERFERRPTNRVFFSLVGIAALCIAGLAGWNIATTNSLAKLDKQVAIHHHALEKTEKNIPARILPGDMDVGESEN